MRNKNKLIINQKYDIRYIAHKNYNCFSGEGIYTGEKDYSEGERYGFKIVGSEHTRWFSLEDIFEIS